MAAPTDNLVVFYKCDDGGTTAPQDTGSDANDNHQVLQSNRYGFSTNYEYETVDGQTRITCLADHQNDDYLRTSTHTGITATTTDDITVCAYVKPSTYVGDRIMSINSDSFAWQRGINTKHGLIFGGNFEEVNYAHAVNSGEYIAIVFDESADTIKVYSDGVLQATKTGVTRTTSFTNEDLALGNRSAQHLFAGSISHFRLYLGKALTDAEVEDVYNEDAGVVEDTTSVLPIYVNN